MCIRDSSWLDGANGKPLGDLQETLYALLDELVRDQWPFDLVFEPVLEEARVEAVSYTHLRAHETVLDPVCRFLLEKKKQPTPPPPPTH